MAVVQERKTYETTQTAGATKSQPAPKYSVKSAVWDDTVWGLVFKCGLVSDTAPINGGSLRTWIYSDRITSKNVPYNPHIHKEPLPYLVEKRIVYQPAALVSDVLVESASGGCEQSALSGSFIVDCSNPTVAAEASSYLPVSQALRNHAIAKMHDKIEDQKTIHANYAVFLGESGKSLDMISKNVKDVAMTLLHLKKGRFKKAYQQLFGRGSRKNFDPKFRSYKPDRKRRWEDLWLEWTYGWSPLIGETYDILDDLRGRKPKFRITVSGQAADKTSVVRSASMTGSIGSTSIAFPLNVEIQKTTQLRYTCYYTLDNQYWSDLAASGITSPGTLVWELIPFSFVADWFVNVGEYIRGLTIGNGWTYLSGCESIKQTVNSSLKYGTKGFNAVRPGYMAVEGTFVPRYGTSMTKFERNTLVAPPSLTINLKHRQWHSVSRIISSAALIKQLLK